MHTPLTTIDPALPSESRAHSQPIVDVDRETIRAAYAIGSEKNHDVYDCFYLAVARQADVEVLCTTDTDFETLCRNEPFVYQNPVPSEVLEQFHEASQ